ncbi:MAG: cation:dicarboxylase symporter family transporter, partial [Arenicella sp.]|nr:cation:dicarboxylase symporter family transporter [Arenicella sp.]
GIVILATILTNIGVPASGIALILGVDRILDMSRTAINVTGDLTACVVMDRWLPPKSDDLKAV